MAVAGLERWDRARVFEGTTARTVGGLAGGWEVVVALVATMAGAVGVRVAHGGERWVWRGVA